MRGFLVLSLFLLPSPIRAQGQEKVIDLRANRPFGGNTIEASWATYRKAEQAGDSETALRAFREIRRLRTERNIPSLEEFALALVADGEAQLKSGSIEKATERFKNAILVDPHLPDAHFGLAQASLKSGPIGALGVLRETFAGFTARLGTSRGSYYLLTLIVPVGLLTVLTATTVFALCLLVRDGPLLLHDIEESFTLLWGRATSVALFGLLLLLPSFTFQGYGWLPLWWLALLYVYLSGTEKGLVAGILGLTLAVGPITGVLADRTTAEENPLFRASMNAVEAGPDKQASDELERAAGKMSDDRDLTYLLAREYKKSGQYDAAAELYKQLLDRDKNDPIALNNLANIEFAEQQFQAAIARYKKGVEVDATPDFASTLNYNLSLAYLQKFDPQPAQEARSQAERLSGALVKAYDGLWPYENNANAVVDLGLKRSQIWAKFSGIADGVGKKNLAGSAVRSLDAASILPRVMNRFLGFVGVFAVTVFLVTRWRGPRMFTMKCVKCGTPFCKRCQLGVAVAGLCTQCHHLFVVRDGVSGPARNQKLLEVQKEDVRRERVFRVLSFVSPGAGHIYAQKTLPGLLIVTLWYGVVALMLLAGSVFPVTEAPGALTGYWGLGLGGVIIVLLFVVANRARPDFDVAVPMPRPAKRRKA